MTELRFNGELPLWAAISVALVGALAAFLLYRRELRQGWAGWLLPILRSLAVVLILLMLAGPELAHVTGEDFRGRVLVLVDSSQSMSVVDKQMPEEQKQRLAKRLELEPLNLASEDPGNADERAKHELDQWARWQRAERLLLDLEDGALSQIAEDNDVTVLTLAGGAGDNRAVSSGDPTGLPVELPGQPEAGTSDLASELERVLGESGGADRLAVVLVSDGRHNTGPSLTDAALRARAAGVPIHSIAMGTTQMPHDLAITDVTHPATVLPDGRVAGTIQLLDAMPAGRAYKLQVVQGDTVLWEQARVTAGSQSARRGEDQTPGRATIQEIDYSFDAKDAVQTAEEDLVEGLKVNQLPIALQARVIELDGDSQAKNDRVDFQVRSVLGERKMLILAGRPRWEMRYIDSMFSRDPRWEVTTLFAATGDGRPWPRSDDPEADNLDGPAFPATRDGLMDYDLIVLGEVRPGTLSDGELTWLYEFVANRAGGMIIIDGRRGYFTDYARSPLGPLLPKRKDDRGRRPLSLSLTVLGQSSPATMLEPDPAQNQALWPTLEPPSYIAPIVPTPGIDTVLVEAKVSQSSDETWPAVLSRRVGAGWVWYSAIDETWRWRRDHESLYQHRYWHQVTNRVIEPLYAAEDRYVSLGVDQSVIQSGSTLPIRVRLRDDKGRPRTQAEATVHLSTLEGQRVMQARLKPDAAEGGRFTAELNPTLPPGVYRVGISVADLSDSEVLATTLVTIRGSDQISGELADVTLNLPLLQQVSDSSQGTLLREHEVDRLSELLEGLSESTRQETVTRLWQSWPWFLAVVSLLGIEFGLRRRLGML